MYLLELKTFTNKTTGEYIIGEVIEIKDSYVVIYKHLKKQEFKLELSEWVEDDKKHAELIEMLDNKFKTKREKIEDYLMWYTQ